MGEDDFEILVLVKANKVQFICWKVVNSDPRKVVHRRVANLTVHNIMVNSRLDSFRGETLPNLGLYHGWEGSDTVSG